MNTILIYVLVGILSAIAALWTYILIRKVLLKGQKEEIIRKAEIEAESIKKEKIFQAKEKFLQLKSGEMRQKRRVRLKGSCNHPPKAENDLS